MSNVTQLRMRQDSLLDAVRGVFPANNQTGNFQLATDLYINDGIAQTIVDRPAEDAVSRGFKIIGDEAETILNEMDRLNASIHITDALRWARLTGASAILVLCQDGAPLSEPLNLAKLKVIDDLIVYDADSIDPESETYIDPMFRNYGLPTRYRLSPLYGQPFIVHETRLIKFTGDPVPKSRMRIRQKLHWQGRSSLDAPANDLYRYRAGLRLAKQIMERKQQAVHAMAGLSEMLGDPEGQAIVQKKIAMTDAVRGIVNGITIDGGPGNGQGEGDKYTIIDLSLGGIDTVMGEFRDALSASSRMGQAILFGADIKGLGSTGKGEQSIHHSLVKSVQERSLRPAMEEFAGMIWSQSSITEKEPEKWRLEFNELWSATALENAEVDEKQANARKTNMEAVELMVTSLLATPEEAREAMIQFWQEVEFNDSYVPEMPDPNPEPTNVKVASGGSGAGGR